MKNNELFQTLEQLKETLSDVASARKQVSETVKAYDLTQNEIRSYIGNLNQIEVAISSLITLFQDNKVVLEQQSTNAVNNLKTSCDTILNHAKNEFADTSQRFSEATDKNLSTMSTLIERFDLSIDTANTLTNKVEATAKEVSGLIDSVKILLESLVNSQRSQYDAIGTVSKNQEDIKVSLLKQEEILQGHTHTLETIGNSISENSDSIRKDLSTLYSVVATSLSSLNTSIDGLNSSLNRASAKITKGANINRGLIIAAFIILAILQYFFR